MSKFELPAQRGKVWARTATRINTGLDEDLQKPFSELREAGNISASKLINAMIRHCLNDIGKLK